MINVSTADENKIASRPLYKIRVLVTKADGGTFWLEPQDFAVSGNRFSFAGDGQVPLGKVVSKTCELSVVQWEDASVFIGARLSVSVYFADSTQTDLFTENYWVDEIDKVDGTVTIIGSDCLSKLDQVWTPPSSGIPMNQRTLFNLATRIATQCGMTLNPVHFANDDFIYLRLPYKYTCRELLGFIAQIAGGNVVASHRSSSPSEWGFEIKEISTLDQNGLESFIGRVDIGESIDVTGFSTQRTMDINRNEQEPELFIAGDDGYVIELINPLIWGKEQEVLDYLNDQKDRWPIAISSFKHIAYPIAEFADYTFARPSSGYNFSTLITDCTWEVNGGTEFACNVESNQENSREYGGDPSAGISDVYKRAEVSGPWTVFRSDNGAAIAMCKVEVDAVACTTALSNMFRTAKIDMPNFPVNLFKNTPNVHMDFHSNAGTGAMLWTVGTSDWDFDSAPEPQYLIRPAASNAVTGFIQVTAIGWWKESS